MRILLLLVAFCVCCIAEPEAPEQTGDASNVSTEPVAGEEDDADERSEEDLREEAALLAEQVDIERRLKEGLPLPEEEARPDMSAYQRWLKEKGALPADHDPGVPAWLRLGRWCMSEGPVDCEALLQMAHNLRHKGESLSTTVARRAPRVSLLKKPTAARQLWTSTLPAEGEDPPSRWFECTETKKLTRKNGTVKWKRLPEGCHGFWAKTGPQWVKMRDWAKNNIHRRPRVIKGVPIDQGGVMDVWRVLQKPEYRHLCFIGQPNAPRGNLFYGLRSDPRNKCLPVPDDIVSRSKTVSVRLMKKREAFRKAQRRIQRIKR